MAMRGQVPKHPDDRQRRNQPLYELDEVAWDGEVRGPELPDYLEGIVWHTRTREWWEKWRRSPQSMVMTEVDWENMLETAILHNRYWRATKISDLTQLSKVISARLASYGGTYEDRRKLRLEVPDPQTQTDMEKKVSRAAEEAVNYAEMLNKAASQEK